MSKLRIVVVVLAVVVLLLASVSGVWAYPPLPSSFYGEIHISDNPPTTSDQVLVYVPGVTGSVGTGSIRLVGANLVYSIDVRGDDTDTPDKDGGVAGDVITFQINGRVVMTGIWHGGTNLHQDIHPPDAVVTNNGPVAEGSPVMIDASSSQDWGTDIATYAFDCANDGTYEIGPQAGATAQCTFDDGPSSHTVAVRVMDLQGGVGTDTTPVVVNNVAPAAIFNAPTNVNEGSAIALSLITPSDPSSADTTAGFEYAFDCGDGSGYGAWSATSTTSCPTTDNGSRAVGAKIRDKDLSEREYTVNVAINNVAPTAVLSNNGPVAEASPATISFSNQYDPSATDTTAGFHYAYACDGGALDTATYANTTGNTASTQCIFPDGPSTHTVRARIIDKDDGFSEYMTEVTINNVVPIVTTSGDASVNEGATYTLNLNATGDPGLDTISGWSIDWGDGNIVPVTGNPTSVTHVYVDGPNTYTVAATATDEDGTYSANSLSVTVNNVAPTVSAGDDQAVAEGSLVTLPGLFTDPGTADTHTFLWHLVSSTNGQIVADGNTQNFSFTPNDNGVYTFDFTVTDKDGGSNTDTVVVTVSNVAPTASFGFNTPVNEGGDIVLALTGASDPSSADTTAGFTYAFDCGSGYGTFGSNATATCTTTDNGTRSVRAMIRDKDGGETEYTAIITINDVLPLSEAGGPYNGIAGQPVTLTGIPTCVIVDACTVEWLYNATSLGTANSVNYTWNMVGDYTVMFRVTDNDGNVATNTAAVHITGATHSITLVPGWNLVSFNLIPVSTDPATLLASLGTNYDLVYAWDAHETSNNWLRYDRTVPFGNTLTHLDETMGFWIHVTASSSVTLNVVGSVPTSTSISFDTAAGGWNLVSYPATTNRDLPNVLAGTNSSMVYAYHADETADPWKLYDFSAPPWSNDLAQLSPGWGYWVKVSEPGTWTVNYP